MTSYSYFIICNTDDPKVFYIECTSMSDYRLRFSAMKSCFNKKSVSIPIKFNSKSSECTQLHTSEDLPNYMRVLQTNYFYYLLEKKSFETVEEAIIYRDLLIKQRLEKYANFVPECKFKLTFNQPELPDTLEASLDEV